jgi:hypothetical protein
MNMCRGSSCIAAVILNLNTRWWWLVSLVPWPLCPSEGAPDAPEYEAEFVPDLVWMFFKGDNCLACARIQTPYGSACSVVTILTMLPWLVLFCKFWT